MIVYPCLAVVLFFLFLAWRYAWLIPKAKGLPVLMYHKISNDHSDTLTILYEELIRQLEYLYKKKYTTLNFNDLDLITKLPEKAVILTFDDAYANLPEMLLPALAKFGFKATVFVPVSFIGKTNEWDQGYEPIMNESMLRTIDQNQLEIGLHGFRHINYKTHSAEEIRDDIESMLEYLNKKKIIFFPAIAYPYGGYPRIEPLKSNFKNYLKHKGILYGLRIGNRINKWPLKDPYEMKRIDVKGNGSFREFKIKLQKGRTKLF